MSPWNNASLSNIRDTDDGGGANEEDALLGDHVGQTDDDGHFSPDWSHPLNSAGPNPHADLPVYKTIHRYVGILRMRNIRFRWD